MIIPLCITALFVGLFLGRLLVWWLNIPRAPRPRHERCAWLRTKKATSTAMAALAIVIMFTGCEREEPNVVTVHVAKSSHEMATAEQLMKLSYLTGWNDGFSIAKGIHNNTYQTPAEANEAADKMLTNFMQNLPR